MITALCFSVSAVCKGLSWYLGDPGMSVVLHTISVVSIVIGLISFVWKRK